MLLNSFRVSALSLLLLTGIGCQTAPRTGPASSTPRPVASRGACDHPYYPIGVGYEADFQTRFNGQTSTYRMRVNRQTGNRLTLATTFESGTQATQTLLCENGSWVADSYVDLAALSRNRRVRVETTRVDGPLLPRDLATGSTWSTTFSIIMHFDDDTLRQAGFGDVNATIRMERMAEREESVTVPSGTYTAIKVVSRTNIDMGTSPIGSQDDFTTTEWWVRDVGLVKSEVSNPSGSNMTSEATRIQRTPS